MCEFAKLHTTNARHDAGILLVQCYTYGSTLSRISGCNCRDHFSCVCIVHIKLRQQTIDPNNEVEPTEADVLDVLRAIYLWNC